MRCVLVLALLVAACTDDRGSGLGGNQRSAIQVLPIAASNQLDVLFVVDDSPAMAAHREHAIFSAEGLVDALAALPNGLPDVHIGVTSADPGDRGYLVATGAPVTGTYASDIRTNDGGRMKNYLGQLRDVVGTMVDVGATGAATQPLAMATTALENHTSNAGFLRDHAFLAVVVLAAGDDASSDAVESYVARIKRQKVDPNMVLVFTVRAGDTPRLTSFLAQFPNRSADGELAASDPDAVYDLFAHSQVTTLGLPCWGSHLLDVNAIAPGVQTDCTAELHTSKLDLAIAACADGETEPCYSIVDEPQCTESGLRTKLSNFGPFSDGTVTIECLVAQ